MINESLARSDRETMLSRHGATARGAAGNSTRALVTTAMLGVAGALLIAACSSSSTTRASSPVAKSNPSVTHSASASPSLKAAVCVHVNSLRTSLTSLSHVTVGANSANQLASDLTNIEDQLAALKGQPLGSLSTPVNQLTAEVNQIKKTAASLSTNSAGAVKTLTMELSSLKSKAGPAIAEMKTACRK